MDFRLAQRRARIKDLCGRHIYPWLVKLAERNKEQRNFPLFVGDYYDDIKDKEVAEAAALLIPFKDSRDKYLIELHNIIGDSPRKMIENRAFLHLAGKRGILRAPRLSGNAVIRALDWAWETCVRDKIPLEYAILGELGIINRRHTTPADDVFPQKDLKIKMGTLLFKMAAIESLWDFLDIKDIPCPMTPESVRLAKAYYPIEDGVTNANMPDVIKFFGFKNTSDFMFCVWEYESLRKKYKSVMEHFERKIHMSYKKGIIIPNLKPPVI